VCAAVCPNIADRHDFCASERRRRPFVDASFI
jgi:hypothetical protein